MIAIESSPNQGVTSAHDKQATEAATAASDHLPSQRLALLRPAVWSGGVHPCYSVSVQPSTVAGRQRVATASADKAHGVCIWDLVEVTAAADPADSSGGVTVKLEDSAPTLAPRGLLTILPHHLSAVNVVRWEPVIGARLASGSDLPTQSIIVWKREENRADADAAAKGNSSAPFGLSRSSSNPSSVAPSSSSGDSASAFSNVEHWAPLMSLHGQTDITDLAWGPPGLHFNAVSHEDDFGFSAGGGNGSHAPVGCTMDSPAAVAARLARGLGSQVLASCSLDRSVIVWNTDSGDRHSLKGHTGWVLGISFDPTGSFLATQTIDGFVWIWSLATFQLSRKIRDVGLTLPKSLGIDGRGPRTDVGRTVSFARISWTPDGAALVACRGEVKRSAWGSSVSSAKKRSTIKHVSVALNRKRNFETQAVFGGHAGRTTVSAFNPVLFLTDSSGGTAEKRFFSVLAVGSHDCTLSLWSTRRPTPLLLLTEIWTESILDLSWTADGRTLVVSAHDGSIVVLQFDEGVFGGRAATEEERSDRMRSLYGEGEGASVEAGSLATSRGVLASTHGLYDSPALLEMQAQQKLAQQRLKAAAEQEHKAHAAEREEKQALERKNASPPVLTSSSAPATAASLDPEASTLSLQTVVRRADGKRRIIPVSVAAPVAESSSFISATAARSTSTSASTGSAATAGSSAASHLAHATPAMLMALTAGAVEMEDAGAGASAMPPSNAADDLFGELDAAKPKKRKRVDEDSTDANAAATKAAKSSDAASSAAAAASSAAAAARPSSEEFMLPAPVRPMRWTLPVPASSAASFAPPPGAAVSLWELQVTDYAGKPLTGSGAPAASALPSTSQATIISAFAPAASSAAASGAASSSSRQLAWQSFVPHRVLLSAGNSAMLVLACADTASGQFYLHCLSTSSGRQLHPPLLLTAAPFLLSMHSKDNLGSLLIITCDGLVRVYDLAASAAAGAKRLRIQASVRTMLRSSSWDAKPGAGAGGKKKSAAVKEEFLSIVAARLSADDTPVIVLSNHHAFRYDASFESWSLVASATPSFPGSDMRSELTLFQRTATQQLQHMDDVSTLAAPSAASAAAPSTAVPLAVLNSMDARTRVLHTLAHLESELTLRMASGDAAAYRLALMSYVAKLVSLCPAVPSALLKLTDVCRELQGPGSASVSSSQGAAASSAAVPARWQPFIWVSPRTHALCLFVSTKGNVDFVLISCLCLCVQGLSKRSLLASLLPLLHTNPHLHAFTMEISQQ